MQIIGEKRGYLIHEATKNNYCLCRILNEYDNSEDAHDDLFEILAGNMTEEDVLKLLAKKQMEERI